MQNYLIQKLPSIRLDNNLDDIDIKTTAHAQHVQQALPSVSVEIHNHMDLLTAALAETDSTERLTSFIRLLNVMSQLDVNWNKPDAFLHALYWIDLKVVAARVQELAPTVWLHMQPENALQTSLIEQIVRQDPQISVPVIKAYK